MRINTIVLEKSLSSNKYEATIISKAHNKEIKDINQICFNGMHKSPPIKL
jgi:hypothetical protein